MLDCKANILLARSIRHHFRFSLSSRNSLYKIEATHLTPPASGLGAGTIFNTWPKK